MGSDLSGLAWILFRTCGTAISNDAGSRRYGDREIIASGTAMLASSFDEALMAAGGTMMTADNPHQWRFMDAMTWCLNRLLVAWFFIAKIPACLGDSESGFRMLGVICHCSGFSQLE